MFDLINPNSNLNDIAITNLQLLSKIKDNKVILTHY